MGSVLEQVCDLLAVLLWVSTAVHAAQNSLIQPCRHIIIVLSLRYISLFYISLFYSNFILSTSVNIKHIKAVLLRFVFLPSLCDAKNRLLLHSAHSTHSLGCRTMQASPLAFDRYQDALEGIVQEQYQQQQDIPKFLCKGVFSQQEIQKHCSMRI